MKITDKYVFFWGGVFSQWQSCKFEDNNGIKYSSAEQYMMYHKALLFNDLEIANKIMNIKDVKEIKQLGREVKNFDKEIWEDIANDIVYLGTYFKFSQNEELKNSIFKYNDKEFVEASPKDKIWGVGLHETNPLILDKNNWLGTNWLGNCVTEVTQDLFNDCEIRFQEKLNKINDKIYHLENDIEFH